MEKLLKAEGSFSFSSNSNGRASSFDCIAAALGYLGFVFAVALPAWIFTYYLLHKPATVFGKNTEPKERELVAVILLLWNYLLMWSGSTFLPDSGPQAEGVSHSVVRWLMLLGAFQVVGAIVLSLTRTVPKFRGLYRIQFCSPQSSRLPLWLDLLCCQM